MWDYVIVVVGNAVDYLAILYLAILYLAILYFAILYLAILYLAMLVVDNAMDYLAILYLAILVVGNAVVYLAILLGSWSIWQYWLFARQQSETHGSSPLEDWNIFLPALHNPSECLGHPF